MISPFQIQWTFEQDNHQIIMTLSLTRMIMQCLFLMSVTSFFSFFLVKNMFILCLTCQFGFGATLANLNSAILSVICLIVKCVYCLQMKRIHPSVSNNFRNTELCFGTKGPNLSRLLLMLAIVNLTLNHEPDTANMVTRCAKWGHSCFLLICQ